ncbi:MAG: ABC transporter permease subunit [Clostridia bacterium]|nr:ABC transporter permease subunit [Clostridia bacterium]
MFAVFKRELSSYLNSMIGATFLFVYFLFSGIYFFYVLSYGTASLAPIFNNMFIVLILLIPILTMRLLSEERRTKTDQVLLTAPVGLWAIVLGKFLSAFIMLCIATSINVIFGLVLNLFGSPDWMSILSNIIGQLLLGAALIAIGLFISSLTESQVIAAISTFGVSLFFVLLDSAASLVEYKWVSDAVKWISFNDRYNEFTEGVVNISSIVFFISAAVIFIFLTTRSLDKRRWN